MLARNWRKVDLRFVFVFCFFVFRLFFVFCFCFCFHFVSQRPSHLLPCNRFYMGERVGNGQKSKTAILSMKKWVKK